MSDSKTNLEETLRNHTRQIIQQVKNIPGLGFGSTQQNNTSPMLATEKLAKTLDHFFHPSNHVFLGAWQRTSYTSGAWPTCLNGSHTARTTLSGYDAADGVVWRFISPQSSTSSYQTSLTSSDPHSSTATKYTRLRNGVATTSTYIELVDHNNFSNGTSHLYVSKDLALVSNLSDACIFQIKRCKPFRNGPADDSVVISVNGLGDRELILCSTGVNDGSEVVLVGEDRLESMHGDGSLIYNVAWEVTPDSDSTLLLKEDDIPLEKYIDDFRFRMSTSKSGEEDSNGKKTK